MNRQQSKIVEQVEGIGSDLLKVKKRLGLLGDMAGLDQRQKDAVESLVRGLDGVRACQLGILRQSIGLDEHLSRKGLSP